MGEIDPAVVYKKTYWDRPPQDSKGDGKIEAIYEAVGYALSHWEQADQELANLFLNITTLLRLSQARERRTPFDAPTARSPAM